MGDLQFFIRDKEKLIPILSAKPESVLHNYFMPFAPLHQFAELSLQNLDDVTYMIKEDMGAIEVDVIDATRVLEDVENHQLPDRTIFFVNDIILSFLDRQEEKRKDYKNAYNFVKFLRQNIDSDGIVFIGIDCMPLSK